ncbi:MAG: AMP-binding protein, partial [Solimonas sp.]
MTTRNPVEMLLHWAQERPTKPWMFQAANGKWQAITWAEAEVQVRSMASALRARYAPGTAIAISGRNTAHWFMADLAIAMAGCISVGLYPKQSTAAVQYILNHAEAKAVFIGPSMDIEEFLGQIPAGIDRINFPYPGVPTGELNWDELVRTHEPYAGYTPPDPKQLWTLVYTSGTTGNPKGVMISGENLSFATQGLMKAMPALGQERFFSYLPLAHAFERGAVELSSIYFGAEVYFLEHIEKLAEQLREVAPTRFFGVPL